MKFPFLLLFLALAGCSSVAAPIQPTPASITSTQQALAAMMADPSFAGLGPVQVWQVGDYQVRAACHAYLSSAAIRSSNLALASGGLGMAGTAATGFLAAGGGFQGAAAAAGLTALGQSFLALFQASGPTPSVADGMLVMAAMDAREAGVLASPPSSVPIAMSDVDDQWFDCSWGGISTLRDRASMTANVTAVRPGFALAGTFSARPRILINDR